MKKSNRLLTSAALATILGVCAPLSTNAAEPADPAMSVEATRSATATPLAISTLAVLLCGLALWRKNRSAFD